MRVALIRCLVILVLLALPVTNALAQPPAPESTPTPQATGPIRLGFFALDDLVNFATLVGIIIVALVSAYTAYLLRPMQRREVELLERQVQTLEREKKALENILTKEKAYLETQLRDAKEKANIPHDATLPSEPVSLDPKDRETLQQILGRLERIESVSIAAGAEKPRPDPWEYISEGNLHFNLQQYEQAIEKYNEALELKPNFPEALNNRGLTYRHLGQSERAIQDYDKALELKPDYPGALSNRGLAYRRLGQHDRAIQDFNKALELKPDYATALSNRAAAYGELGQHERALQDSNRALKLKPDYATALSNRGAAYAHLEEYERAIQDLNRALELDPDFDDPRYNMACAYSLMNKPDEALKWLREAIDLDEENLDLTKTDPDFDNIRDDPRFRALVYGEEGPAD